MTSYENDREVHFDIIEEIGVISTKSTGWSKELNVVRWNGGPARYDIREWDPFHESMSRGITFDEPEMRRVVELLRRRKRYASRPVKQQSETKAPEPAPAPATEQAAEEAWNDFEEAVMETANEAAAVSTEELQL